MRLRTIVIIVAVVVCLGLFVFGREVFSYLAGAREYTGVAVKDRIPPEFEISRLNAMLMKLDRTITHRREALVDMQIRAETLEKEIAGRHKTLSEDRGALEKALVLLEDGRESYTIGGVAYTRAEVDSDARIKAERFRQDTDLLATRDNTLERLHAAIADVRKTVSDAEVERQRLADAVQGLEIRADSLATMQHIDARKEHVSGVSLGKAYKGIEKAISDLDRRLAKGERLHEIREAGTDGINYAGNDVQQSGLAALREVLR